MQHRIGSGHEQLIKGSGGASCPTHIFTSCDGLREAAAPIDLGDDFTGTRTVKKRIDNCGGREITGCPRSCCDRTLIPSPSPCSPRRRSAPTSPITGPPALMLLA